jgi:RNA polymerase sigma-70 factor, ECF subfamily
VAVAVRLPRSAAPEETADLFERYSARIHAYCLHVLRDRSEAEDAVQTTFLNAHRALRRGVTPLNEYAWLHTIAKNVCRMQLRTRRRRATLVNVDLDTIPGQDDGDHGELRAALAEALTGLPERQRQAVVLRELHGLTPQEIAPRLGLSVPATYTLLTRARRSLANLLTDTVRAPLVIFDLSGLADVFRGLKAYLGSAASKTAVAAVVVTASVGVGSGVVVDRSLRDGPDRIPSAPASATVAPDVTSAAGGAAVAGRRADAAGRSTRFTSPSAAARLGTSARSTVSVVTAPTQAAESPSEPTTSGEHVLPPTGRGAGISSATSEERAPGEEPGLPGPPPPVQDVVDAATSAVEDPPLPPLPPLPVPPELPTEGQTPPPPDLPPLPQLPLP